MTGSSGETEQERVDVAFRVIADHIRTLSFAVADGILPGNTDRNYVLRRILRRAVRYGRSIGLEGAFFHKLVDPLADSMGGVFPELQKRREMVKTTLRTEEEAFMKTLDRGMDLFHAETRECEKSGNKTLTGAFAFKLYDTYGFPLDLTELMARELGLGVDTAGFEVLMEAQRDRARAARKTEVIELSDIKSDGDTRFVGFEDLECSARVLNLISTKQGNAVILDTTACYAEMGGQVGDCAELFVGGALLRVVDTRKAGGAWLHFLEEAEGASLPEAGSSVMLTVDRDRRRAIERHHTVTHLLHWALHEVVGRESTQKGSFVGPEKLTFDFNSGALSATQLADIERLVNERIVENDPVSWSEVPYGDVRQREDIMQVFGDKYGDNVRVVQIGGKSQGLNGFSMELCGGTHTRSTGEIGLFRILSEAAVAAGVRRIEAVAGLPAYQRGLRDTARLQHIAELVGAPNADVERKIEAMLLEQKALERTLHSLKQKQAAAGAVALLAEVVDGSVPMLVRHLPDHDGDMLQSILEAMKGRFDGVAFLAGTEQEKVSLAASVAEAYTGKIQAGKLIQAAAPLVDGKGGGRPELARGAGKNPSGVDAALKKVQELISAAG